MADHIYLHQGDLEYDVDFGDVVAIDTEAMGLNTIRDRLCLVQLSAGDGTAHLVQIPATNAHEATRLRTLLLNSNIQKLFHYARFDVAILQYYLRLQMENIYCTKVASKLSRTYTDRHGLKILCQELLGITLEKEAQSSNWGAETLTEAQKIYAANDVLYLHQLKAILDQRLEDLGRQFLADACFKAIPVHATLDVLQFAPESVFSY